MGEPVRFIGAGPGDPELITVKGMRYLQEADRVVYAGSLVPETLLQYCRKNVKAYDSASLTLTQTHALLKEGYEAGERVVRLHTGDPSLYGAINEQLVLLDRDKIAHEVVPGVSAAFAACCRIEAGTYHSRGLTDCDPDPARRQDPCAGEGETRSPCFTPRHYGYLSQRSSVSKRSLRN